LGSCDVPLLGLTADVRKALVDAVLFDELFVRAVLGDRAAAFTASSLALGFPRRMFSRSEQLNRKLSCVTKLTDSDSCVSGISFTFTPPMVISPELTRPSPILCKPPMWCIIGTPHWRFY